MPGCSCICVSSVSFTQKFSMFLSIHNQQNLFNSIQSYSKITKEMTLRQHIKGSYTDPPVSFGGSIVTGQPKHLIQTAFRLRIKQRRQAL